MTDRPESYLASNRLDWSDVLIEVNWRAELKVNL